MLRDPLKLNVNNKETRILKFMIAIASNIPNKAFHDNPDGLDEYAYKTLDLAIALNNAYEENWT